MSRIRESRDRSSAFGVERVFFSQIVAKKPEIYSSQLKSNQREDGNHRI